MVGVTGQLPGWAVDAFTVRADNGDQLQDMSFLGVKAVGSRRHGQESRNDHGEECYGTDTHSDVDAIGWRITAIGLRRLVHLASAWPDGPVRMTSARCGFPESTSLVP